MLVGPVIINWVMCPKLFVINANYFYYKTKI
jgi:hypothetical protein